jgi:hypothetical protein
MVLKIRALGIVCVFRMSADCLGPKNGNGREQKDTTPESQINYAPRFAKVP